MGKKFFRLSRRLMLAVTNIDTSFFNRVRTSWYKRFLGSYGNNLRIGVNTIIDNPENIHFGNNCKIGPNNVFRTEKKLIIGDSCRIRGSSLVELHSMNSIDTYIGKDVNIVDALVDLSGKLVVEDHVWISSQSIIYTHNHIVTNSLKIKRKCPKEFNSLHIGRDAWIATRSIILPSVSKIGKGAIIGAGAVITKNVPDYAICVGNPATVVGYRKEK